MQYKILLIPYAEGSFDDSEFQKFLEEHNVANLARRFFVHDGNPYWTVFLGYDDLQPQKNKKTQENVLETFTEEDKELYEILRKWRNEEAKGQSYSPYILFTNNQLACIAKQRPLSLQKLGEIHGVGDNKLEKYGKPVLAIVQEFITKRRNP